MEWIVLACATLVAGCANSPTTDRFRVRVSPLWTKGVNLARSSWRNLTASVTARTLKPGVSKARRCTIALNDSPEPEGLVRD
jgi:hypothetical protein